ncbi:LOW QUALITY PROTEIN: microspherule protein 1-like [Uloborus diversus]|uniref:LOW QUALITY PROTEIN: microspherule protein 1-like n=1 Tax=Uloborus diversus TaxID=327109 RepID=UPI002409A11E|nr:LOW QUALITY PROTEIN: microspherule protein 1-like [Uloborus diversus]
MSLQMAGISDSSQEASNTASPKIFMKAEVPELPSPGIFVNNPLMKSGQISTEQSQKRRSSSRSIKRKKFDDELVESSLIKTSRARPQNVPFTLLSQAVSLSTPTLATPTHILPSTSQLHVDVPEKKKQTRPPQKRIKKPKNNQTHLTKDVSRWKPTDDLNLILSVQQTNDLETVFKGVKFSSNFTLKEVQQRWYSLLYDVSVSKTALFAIKQLNPEVISQIQAKVLFSAEEEKLIASVPSTTLANLEVFQSLLDLNVAVFLPSRTAKVLFAHWTLMKQYNLLHDQTVHQPLPVESHLNFSDAEDFLEDSDVQETKNSVLEEELSHARQRSLAEIKQLENEIPKMQTLVECVTGVSIPEFDKKTLAVLTGRIVRYLIQSAEVTLGRSAKDNKVDIDFSQEGPAWKISRRQGIIKMEDNGDFFIINEGKKAIFVDGKPVLSGNKCKINNNSVIEITILRFIFIVNHEAIAPLKAKNNC